MMNESQLVSSFSADIDKMVTEFINDYGLKYEEEEKGLASPLLRWLDFVARYIEPRPRQIVLSNNFPKKLDPTAEQAIHQLESAIKQGADINPYQSKGLILHNDTSGKKRQQRTDLLWADWGIHHLHLTTNPVDPKSYFSDRSEWLLFCIVGFDHIGFVDVRNHNEQDLFSDSDLILSIIDSWPEVMEKYKLNGVSPASPLPTASEMSQLRKAGITTYVQANGSIYMGPGRGITTASTAARISLLEIDIKRYLRELAKMVLDESGEFSIDAKTAGINKPDFRLAATVRGLAVYESFQNKAYILPRISNVGRNSFLAQLHELVLPEWAHRFLLQKSGHGA